MGSLATIDRTGKGPNAAGASVPKRPRDKNSGGEVGDALRSVYQQVVEEDVPSDFRDMLDKLA